MKQITSNTLAKLYLPYKRAATYNERENIQAIPDYFNNNPYSHGSLEMVVAL
jgi:hypothetical protein